MRIAVIYFATERGGGLSILNDFYEYIKARDKENEWIFLLNDKYIEETERIKIKLVQKYKKSWFKRLKFDYIDGKKIIKDLNIDYILNFQNTMIRGVKKKQALYIHQSLPFQNIKKFSFLKKEERKLAIYQNLIGYLIKNSIKKCDNIIVQTNWMKKSILSKNLCKEKNIKVLSPKINIEVDNSIYEYKNNSFFYPAGDDIYKNHRIIDKAIKMLDKNLEFEVAFTLEEKKEYSEKIKWLGNIQRKEVYKRFKSEVLIFPSYIETYGLPLAECRVSGGIILAADTEFSREILDGYENAYFFKYNNPKELSKLMEQVIEEKIIKKEVVGINNLDSCNTWADMVDIILN